MTLVLFKQAYLSLVILFHIGLVVGVASEAASEKRDESGGSQTNLEYRTDCSKLRPGQYLCLDFNIDPNTQQPKNCHHQLHYANITCQSAPGIICSETGNSTFTSTTPCRPTSGHNYETALLLSIFLGMFGLDRFYLGYPAIGLAKLSTLGFFFLGQLIDIVLIATQTIGPADGSHYVISYYGPAISVVTRDNDTYLMPQPDWLVAS
ncbi:TM2 domain-containing protein CG10795 [Hyalella azteca]|uniref:TM2 domain-containing protein CG10795 n=1 Tax=Hyalella azteca TaxID=294128 RepID=A0A8B7N9S3_HYAAZ|nr:TM2 domain-containing protein CG10795 [Hyalella azteca]